MTLEFFFFQEAAQVESHIYEECFSHCIWVLVESRIMMWQLLNLEAFDVGDVVI